MARQWEPTAQGVLNGNYQEALVLLRRLLNGRRWQLAGVAAALLLAAGGRWLIAA